MDHLTFAISITLSSVAGYASAGYVTPRLGGGAVDQIDAPMKHADVRMPIGSTTVSVTIDESVAAPRLRRLIAPDAFDPDEPWSVLNGKAYNAQFGWNPNGFILLPTGGAFWIENTGSSPGLEVYQAAPESPAYEPILGTAGTPALWKWSTTRMVHNYYAVEDLTSVAHWASYRVYVGDEATGAPLAGYAPAEVTFRFALPGDYNDDGSVDAADRALWAGSYGAAGGALPADGNGDGRVDAADYVVWRDHATPTTALATPEPSGFGLLAIALAAAARVRR